MSGELGNLLSESLDRLFSRTGAAFDGTWHEEVWNNLVEMGVPLLMVDDARGGASGSWEDAYRVLLLAGLHSVPLPIGESMVAARLMSLAGGEIDPGILTVVTNVVGEWRQVGQSVRFTGELISVPWGRYADRIVCVAEGRVYALPREKAQVTPGLNLAGEPRDLLTFSDVAAFVAPRAQPLAGMLLDVCALARLPQIAGCMSSALDLSIQYARERKQFGRAIGDFQAMQQLLAVFGSEVAIVTCAARAACRAADAGDASFQIAAAKLRANQGIGLVTSSAHQVHGAVGFTQEYALRKATQRLWSWRSELGNDRYWSERIGKAVALAGAERFWSDLTARDDAAQPLARKHQ